MTSEELWRLRTDDEIVAAVRSLDDYTEESQRIVWEEMQRRHLDPALFPPGGHGDPLGSVLSDERMRQGLRWVVRQAFRVAAPMLALVACALILDEIHVNSLPLADSPASLQRPLTAVLFALVLFGFVLLGKQNAPGVNHVTRPVDIRIVGRLHVGCGGMLRVRIAASRPRTSAVPALRYHPATSSMESRPCST